MAFTASIMGYINLSPTQFSSQLGQMVIRVDPLTIGFSLLGLELFSILETGSKVIIHRPLCVSYEENHIVDQNSGGKLNIQPVSF
jgi:hypothetical protein